MSKIFITLCLIICILIAGCVGSGVKNTTNPISPSKNVLQVKYFTIKGCNMCGQTDALLANLSAKYPGKFVLTHYDLTDNKTNRAEFLRYSSGIKIKTVPFIVINERNILSNYTEIINDLEPSIKGSKRLV